MLRVLYIIGTSIIIIAAFAALITMSHPSTPSSTEPISVRLILHGSASAGPVTVQWKSMTLESVENLDGSFGGQNYNLLFELTDAQGNKKNWDVTLAGEYAKSIQEKDPSLATHFAGYSIAIKDAAIDFYKGSSSIDIEVTKELGHSE